MDFQPERHPVKNILVHWDRHRSAPKKFANQKFIKYFPKYFNVYGFSYPTYQTNKAVLISKLKKTKVIRRTIGDISLISSKKNIRLNIFHNKAKLLERIWGIPTSFLHYFPNLSSYQYYEHIETKRAAFFKLFAFKQLSYQYSFSDRNHPSLIKNIREATFKRHLAKLRSLKNLRMEMYPLDKNTQVIFNMFDDNIKFWHYLERLELIISAGHRNHASLKVPVNLFKRANLLEIRDENYLLAKPIFQNFDLFTSLNHLDLDLTPTRRNEKLPEIDFRFLQALKNMQALTKIKLSFNLLTQESVKNFFSNFSLPQISSFEEISLKLENADLSTFTPNIQNQLEEKYFEENPLSQIFSSQWQHVQKVRKFTFHFRGISQATFSPLYLILPILQRLSMVEEVDISNTYQYRSQNIKPVSFNSIWSNIHQLKAYLSDIRIEDLAIDFRNFSLLPKNENPLPKLNYFLTRAFILGTDSFFELLQAITRKISNPIRFRVNFSKIVLEDDQSLDTLFKMLNQFADSKTSLTLGVDVKKTNPNIFKNKLLEFVSRKKKSPNISLKIYRLPKLSGHVKDKLRSILEKSSVFSYLEIFNRNGDSQFEYEEPTYSYASEPDDISHGSRSSRANSECSSGKENSLGRSEGMSDEEENDWSSEGSDNGSRGGNDMIDDYF